MKKLAQLIIALSILTASSAHALTIDYEEVSGTRRSGIYGWGFQYGIGFIDNAIRVDVDLAFSGAAVSDPLWSIWERGIESIWSTDRFAVPILFNVDRVSTGYDYLVNVVDSAGRWNMLTWYVQDFSASRTAAHEFGHMIGNWDEYQYGAVDPVTGLITNGLMGNKYGAVLDHYYDDILSWYDEKLADYGGDTAPVPEPGTFALLAAGLVAMVAVRRRAVSS